MCVCVCVHSVSSRALSSPSPPATSATFSPRWSPLAGKTYEIKRHDASSAHPASSPPPRLFLSPFTKLLPPICPPPPSSQRLRTTRVRREIYFSISYALFPDAPSFFRPTYLDPIRRACSLASFFPASPVVLHSLLPPSPPPPHPDIYPSSFTSFPTARRVSLLSVELLFRSLSLSVYRGRTWRRRDREREVIYRGTRKESYGQGTSYEDARRHSRPSTVAFNEKRQYITLALSHVALAGYPAGRSTPRRPNPADSGRERTRSIREDRLERLTSRCPDGKIRLSERSARRATEAASKQPILSLPHARSSVLLYCRHKEIWSYLENESDTAPCDRKLTNEYINIRILL